MAKTQLVISNQSSDTNSIMEQLLASKPLAAFSLTRGQEVEGEVLSKSDKEVILDLGTKSEGNLSSKDMPLDQFQNLKVGDKIKAYVAQVENEYGQLILSSKPPPIIRGSSKLNHIWDKFIQAQNQKSKILGKIIETNKGGIMVEVWGMRGFLPSSQLGFDFLSKISGETADLKNIELTLEVLEVNQKNNKLIFSQKVKIGDDVLNNLKSFKENEPVLGKVVALLPFGLILDIAGTKGIVYSSDISWERVEDLTSKYSLGQTIEVQVLGHDLNLGRLNLSIKHLSEDPFKKLSKDYKTDEVIKGTVSSISEAGVTVSLEAGAEGFLPASKIKQGEGYEVGETVNFLVDNVDLGRRRINLAPFVTSTEGLIYK